MPFDLDFAILVAAGIALSGAAVFLIGRPRAQR
jgi:hypothetical protein